MKKNLLPLSVLVSLLLVSSGIAVGQIIADHNRTKLPLVPASAITQAKNKLHIVYGHTSHGSQVTTGMNGLVTFTKGCGGPQFAWNNGGSGGALDLHDRGMAGDVGYYPQWVNETKKYLDNPANSDVNVVIWSWCGQHAGYSQQTMIDRYLAPMTQLEKDYPKVMFVYMTGHMNYYSSRANTVARNQQIRDYCWANKKILFDFADIECYNPDNIYFPYVNDNCDYWDKPEGGTRLGNWANEWENSHIQGVEWYQCSSAHSQALNANLKAYAIWWLWARLGGWPGYDSLTRDKDILSVATGGTVNFTLDAGTARKGRNYALSGSFSGTHPGYPLPGNQATLPLNLDGYTYAIIGLANTAMFSNFIGILDSQGKATATLNLGTLPAGIAGFSIHFAYVLYDGALDFASNPQSVVFVP